jgi:hypothetical protein
MRKEMLANVIRRAHREAADDERPNYLAAALDLGWSPNLSQRMADEINVKERLKGIANGLGGVREPTEEKLTRMADELEDKLDLEDELRDARGEE